MLYKFPNYITENKTFLHQIAKTKSQKKLKKIINGANTDQLLSISEIIFNILKGNFPLKDRYRRKLSKNAQVYRQIVRARSEKAVRNHIQTGGALGALSTILVPVIGAIAQSILDNALSGKQKTNIKE